jgi:hypothetical protein
MKNIAIISIVFLLCSCVDKKQSCSPHTHRPFKPALDQLITELTNSWKDGIGENELLSIQFFDASVNDLGFTFRVFLSNWYLRGSVDAYTKYGNTTIAFYGLVNDYYELVNKNSIKFFTDTIDGFSNFFPKPEIEMDSYDYSPPQVYCLVHKADSISVISTNGSFWGLPSPTLIRYQKNDLMIWTPSEEYLKQRFYTDSIQAEKDYRNYKKNVEYYRNKRNTPADNRSLCVKK